MDFLNNLDTGMQFLHRYFLSKCDIAQQNEIIICLVCIKYFHRLLRKVLEKQMQYIYNGDRYKKYIQDQI